MRPSGRVAFDPAMNQQRDYPSAYEAQSGRCRGASPKKREHILADLWWVCEEANDALLRARLAWTTRARARFVFVALALAAVVVAELARLAAPEYDKQFYFDEMWRADLVRTPTFVQRYLTNTAPAPPGWFFVLRLMSVALPDGYRALRLQNVFLDALMFLLLALLIDRMLARSQGRRVTRLVAPVCVPLVALF